MASSLDSRYVTIPISDEHVSEVAQLFCSSFLDAEPTTVALCNAAKKKSDSEADFKELTLRMTKAIIPEKSSYCILDKLFNDKIVAIALTNTFDEKDIHSNNIPDSFLPAFELLEQLDNSYVSYLKELEIRSKKSLYFAVVAIAKEYQGQKLSTSLVKTIQEYAEKSGFGQIFAVATSASQDVFHKCGFKSVKSIVYEEFEYHHTKPFAGVKPFSAVHPEPAAHLMVYHIANI
jgi:N-acetylglutamate synthase-like GNAT family acetyltransferase